MNKLTTFLKKLNINLSFLKMNSPPSSLKTEVSKIMDPPKSVRKMTEWNPDLFKKTISVSYLSIPEEKLNKIQKKFKDNFCKVPSLKPIQSVDSSSKKRLLLDPLKIQMFLDISEEDRKYLESNLDVGQNDFGQMSVELNVDNFLPPTMLKAVLPTDEVEGLSSFSHIGHIIHVNLKEELFPYKKVIGQILLRKANVGMVVNKWSNIDNTFRNFEMEILAQKPEEENTKKSKKNGDKNADTFDKNDFVVSVKENNAKFEFDFSKVYWNPRLCTEHQRMVDLLSFGDILFDVFAGVGPFSVPAALKGRVSKKQPVGIKVFANDLNPNSYDWLKHNFELNKVPKEQYSCFNKDGKDFIIKEVKEGLIDFFKSSAETKRNVHITMNLPAIAYTFLHNFHGLLSNEDTKDFVDVEAKTFPTVHVYIFSKADDKEADVRQNCESEFGGQHLTNLKISFVRNVAPHKDMMRASFPLTMDLLTANCNKVDQDVISTTSSNKVDQTETSEEPDSKKRKIVDCV